MKTIYKSAVCRTEVPKNTSGEYEAGPNLHFYRNGHCRLGNRTFCYGEPIDLVEFEKGCVAARRVDEPSHLYLWERSPLHTFHERVFLYATWERKWYEETPLQDNKFVAAINKHGEFRAKFYHELWDLAHIVGVGVWGYLRLFLWLGALYVGFHVVCFVVPLLIVVFALLYDYVFGG